MPLYNFQALSPMRESSVHTGDQFFEEEANKFLRSQKCPQLFVSGKVSSSNSKVILTFVSPCHAETFFFVERISSDMPTKDLPLKKKSHHGRQ